MLVISGHEELTECIISFINGIIQSSAFRNGSLPMH